MDKMFLPHTISLSNNNLCSVHHWVLSNESACVLISRTDYLCREDEHMSIFIVNIETCPIRKFRSDG